MSRAQNLAKARAQARKRPKSEQPSTTGPLLAGKNLIAVLGVLLALGTIALYLPATGNRFVVFDDRDYVTENPYVHDGLSWNTIKWAFTSTAAANWHPLTWLSHALDYQLFALNPAGHHLDSVLIHALNAVLLFLLLAWVTKRVVPSLLVAALFALHPINVESVAWVAERKNVLCALFFFLAIGAYAWYAQKPEWRRYLLVVALFAAGLMAKPMVITLPFVLLLLDYWPLERMQRHPGSPTHVKRLPFAKLLLEKLPLLLFSAASALITFKAQHNAVRSFEEFPLSIRIENAVVAYGLYLWKMVWPAHLAFYPHSLFAPPAWQVIVSALVLLSVTAFVIVFRSRGYLPVGWFWFLGTLVPVMGLVQVGEASMADRYAYIPLIGIFIMVAWGFAEWADARKLRTQWRVIPAVCVLIALGIVTSRQITFWASEYDVWSHTLAVAEDPFAHNAVGAALMDPEAAMTQQDLEVLNTEQKRMDEARRHFERAAELREPLAHQDPERSLPYRAGTLTNLGAVDRQQNRLEDERQHLESALQIYRQLAPRNPDAYLFYFATTLNNLGFLDRQQNRTDEARAHYGEALQAYRQLAQRNPNAYLLDMATMLNNLGNLDGRENRLDEARQYFEEALQSYPRLAQQNPSLYLPDMATTSNNLGNLDLLQNRPDDARQHFQKALELRRQLADQDPGKYLPDEARTLSDLAFLEQNQNRIEDARAHYEEALNLFMKLAQSDGQYAANVARIEAILKGFAPNPRSK